MHEVVHAGVAVTGLRTQEGGRSAATVTGLIGATGQTQVAELRRSGAVAGDLGYAVAISGTTVTAGSGGRA